MAEQLSDAQYAAASWWYNNGNKQDMALRVVDLDHGTVEEISIRQGRVTSQSSRSCCDGLPQSLFEQLGCAAYTEEQLHDIMQENLDAASYGDEPPCRDALETITNGAGSQIKAITDALHELGDSNRILFFGRYADYFPLEIALRLTYNSVDVSYDDSIFIRTGSYGKLVESGKTLYAEGKMTNGPVKATSDVNLLVYDREGKQHIVTLAKKEQTAEDIQKNGTVELYVSDKNAEVEIETDGRNHKIALPQDWVSSAGMIVRVYASMADDLKVCIEDVSNTGKDTIEWQITD